jgi:phospholipid/cholesterol/gamma-HCH transport system substrate-binding protein
MISQKYETIVGLFVVASLAALLIMVLIIAQQEGLWQDYVEYQAVFNNIRGLKKGSEVRLSGVNVGSVTKTTVRSDGRVLVSFEVLEKYKDQIHHDGVATIGSIGLLGDRSLDLSPGSPAKPSLPPGGMIAAEEPIDFQDILAKAHPSLDSIQKAFDNLTKITEDIAASKGTLGLLVNDPKLYQQTLKTVDDARIFTESLNKGKGALGMIVHDPKLKANLRETLKDIGVTAGNLRQGSGPLSESLAKLPDIVEKVQSFTKNLDQAGEGLPDLVNTGQNALSDVDKVAEGAQKMPLLRRYISKPKERTIQIDREIKGKQ